MNILDKVKKEVPNSPGCYIYYDINNEVIYVGKAKNLKKRMSSYFNRANNTKTQYLVSKINKFDYYVTNNETEALILENNLIKKYNPFYNIVLKDDKTYPYIVVTKEKNPKIIKSRVRNLKAKYYGPYSSSTMVNLIVSYLNKKVPLRQCKNVPNEECIYYHIKQCYGPCIKDVSEKEVKTYTEKLDFYLRNNMKNLIKELESDMKNYASSMFFEEAAKCKELIDMIKLNTESQNVQFDKDINLDFIDYYQDNSFISLCILRIEKGKLINIHRSLLPYYKDNFEEISSYLYSYYNKSVPEYFISSDEQIKEIMEKLLFVKYKKIDNKKFTDLYNINIENAKEYYKKNIDKIIKEYFVKKDAGFVELQKIANDSLNKIEMIDISHIGGDAQVGAIVVYENGKKNNKLYRKYKIKDEKNLQDDYGSIREVLTRRFKRGIAENNLPNLLIVDGGKGQVSVAKEVLESFNLDDIKLIGLSKDDKHKTKGIVNKNLQEKIIDKKSDLYKFLFDIQEEVHRYAIDFHRQVKVKSIFQSELDQIEGIGDKRKKMLLEKFEYVENLKKASYEQLSELKIPKNVIEKILEHFNKTKDN